MVGFTGGRGTNSANVRRPQARDQRDPISDVMTRLRPKLAAIPGARLYLFPRQDFSMGGRQSFSQYQYTLQGDTSEELYTWTPSCWRRCRRTRPSPT